ncbi:hypothetical protein PMAYCL1PPCAC_31715, partial [Pristionchus mayeri]
LRFGKLQHTPLSCRHAAEWSEIRARDNVDEAAAAAQLEFALSREEFEECLAPSTLLNSDQVKENLRFMIAYDKINGKLLKKYAILAARMLEMRFVQQLSKKETVPLDPEHDKLWEELELHFTRAMDRFGPTNEKAEHLHDAIERILRFATHILSELS